MQLNLSQMTYIPFLYLFVYLFIWAYWQREDHMWRGTIIWWGLVWNLVVILIMKLIIWHWQGTVAASKGRIANDKTCVNGGEMVLGWWKEEGLWCGEARCKFHRVFYMRHWHSCRVCNSTFFDITFGVCLHCKHHIKFSISWILRVEMHIGNGLAFSFRSLCAIRNLPKIVGIIPPPCFSLSSCGIFICISSFCNALCLAWFGGLSCLV